MALIISNATIIDAASETPMDGSILIEEGRISAMGASAAVPVPEGAEIIDARGKYAIPGLMNANAHLFMDVKLEVLARYDDVYEDLILEAAQVALKNGITTVFDTFGPRRALVEVRDEIDARRAEGCRIFCGGNIIGFDGPCSIDWYPKSVEVASPAFAKRVNARWAENMGRNLLFLTPEQLTRELHSYIETGIDFIKYASNDHLGPLLCFSEKAQAAIVDEAHRSGLTAQAHCMTVEGVRSAVEAGCDIITHCNLIQGPAPTAIPASTLGQVAQRRTGAVLFVATQLGIASVMTDQSNGGPYPEPLRAIWGSMEINTRNLIGSRARLMFGNDGSIFRPDTLTDPFFVSHRVIMSEEGGGMYSLAHGHFGWFRAMEEMGCPPMEMLRAATVNIAVAYGKDKDLGTLETGKIADMLILERNPLLAAQNYRSIAMVIKDGAIVDREALPIKPILTAPSMAR